LDKTAKTILILNPDASEERLVEMPITDSIANSTVAFCIFYLSKRISIVFAFLLTSYFKPNEF
jgi:hypothetical protein